MEAKQFTVPYPPSLNNIYSTNRSGRRFLKTEGKEYKRLVGNIAAANGCRITDGDVSVRIHVYRPRKAGDLDNSLKILLDAMTGVAWNDDRQIVEIVARRYDDKENPRAVVRIESMGD